MEQASTINAHRSKSMVTRLEAGTVSARLIMLRKSHSSLYSGTLKINVPGAAGNNYYQCSLSLEHN